MSLLNELIGTMAAFLVAAGCPAEESILYTLILLYLLTTGLLAGLLIAVIVRRRHREKKPSTSHPDLES